MLMDPYPSQQHAGLHHTAWQPQQEVTRPKARFKPTSAGKPGVDGGANQVISVFPPDKLKILFDMSHFKFATKSLGYFKSNICLFKEKIKAL